MMNEETETNGIDSNISLDMDENKTLEEEIVELKKIINQLINKEKENDIKIAKLTEQTERCSNKLTKDIECRNMQIILKLYEEESFLLDINWNMTFSEIIEKYKKIKNIEKGNYELTYLCSFLCSYLPVKKYQIPNGSTLRIMPIIYKEMIIFIQINKEFLPLSVDPKILVENLKSLITTKYKIQTDKKKLIFKDQELKDGKQLQEYSIIRNSKIKLIQSYEGKIGIKIQTFYNSEISIETTPNEQIKEIKKKFLDKCKVYDEGIEFIYNNEILEDEKTIDDYSIYEQSEIILSYPMSDNPVHFYIMKPDGKSFEIIARLDEHIIDIKEKIEKITQIPIKEQKLFCENTELNDNDIVQVYSFFQYNTFYLYQLTEESFLINVVVDEKRTIIVEVKPSYTVQNIMDDIHTRFGIRLEDQDLCFNNRNLSYFEKISDLQIKENSVLDLSIYNYQRDNTFYVVYRTFRGVNKHLFFSSDDSTEDLVKTICFLEDLDVNSERIIFCGKQIEFGFTLKDYKIDDFSVLHLVGRLRG